MTNPDPVAGAVRASKLVGRAEAFAEQYQWADADGLFREALRLDASSSNRISYGVFLAHQERYFEAISVFTQVLDGNDRSAIGVVCHNLASIYREVGDADLARRFQWRATLLMDDMGSEDVLGLANDAISANRHSVASSLLMAACGLDDDDDESLDGDFQATMGLIKAELDSPEEGLFALFSAYRQHQAEGDLRGMGADQLNMALLFGKLDRHRAEKSCLERAIRCFTKASAGHSLQKARQQLERFHRVQDVRAFDARRN